MSYSAATASWSRLWVSRPGWARAAPRLPPPTAPMRRVTAAATHTRARLCRRAARAASAAARTSAAPVVGREGGVRAARKPPARAASSSPGWPASMARSKASARARSSLPGSSGITAGLAALRAPASAAFAPRLPFSPAPLPLRRRKDLNKPAATGPLGRPWTGVQTLCAAA